MCRRLDHRVAVVVAAVLALSRLLAPEAAAGDFRVGSIEIANPWTRATPKGAEVAGGYMRITNKGSASDRLIGGSLAVAGRFELHEMSLAEGVMRMRPLAGGLEIKPGETVELKPGSFHIMLMGLTRPLHKGQKIKGTLVFENAGKVDIEYAVEALGAQSSPARAHH